MSIPPWRKRPQQRSDDRRLTRLEVRVVACEAKVDQLDTWCHLTAKLLRVDPPEA